jgi:flagellar protein FlgJ
MNAIELLAQTKMPAAEAPVAPAAPAADQEYRSRAGAAAEKFEGLFIAQMLRQMRASSRALAGEDGFFKDSVGADMLDLTDNMLADKMAGLRSFGIADAILRQLLPPAPAAAPENAAQALHAASGKTGN